MNSKLVAAVLAAVALLPAPAARAQSFINVLTGGTSGVYYPLGVASLKDLSTSSEINVVSVPKEVVDKIGPPFVAVTIPANTYTGQDKDVPTAAVVNYLVTSSAVSDDLAYQMTKLVYESLPELANAHAAGKEIKLETAATGSPIPLHPGAIRYYKEKGLIK